MDVSMDTVSVQIETVVNNSNKAIDSLIGKLKDLQSALSGVVKESKGLSEINKNIPKINQKNQPSRKKEERPSLDKQLSTLGVSLNSKDMVSETQTLDKVITKYKNNLGQVITVQKKMKDGVEQYNVSMRKTFKHTSDLEKFKKSLLGIVSQVGLFLGTIKTVSNKMSEYVDISASYVESVNLFFTEMGDKAEEAYEWVTKFSNALYLDPADVMQYMGAFNSLVNGLGVGADNSYLMSKNLTQLTYDLASYKNLSFETAYEKLMSGISGELEPLRNTGVALAQNTLQELANELGIKKRINTMNEAQKAELRYIQIIRSSTNWQADLGKTLNSTENILKTAGQQWTLFKRALGDVATVVVRFLLPYMVALTQILTKVAKSLANFLGFKIDFSKYKTGSKGVSQSIAGIGNEADKATKKLNTMLAPFDELNVVQNQSQSASSGLSGAGEGLGLDLPEYDALSKLTGEWAKEIEKAKKQLNSLMPVIATVTGALAGMWAVTKIAQFINAVKTIKGALSAISKLSFFTKIGTFITSIPAIKGLGEAFKAIGLAVGSWLDGSATLGEAISFLLPYLATIAQVVGGVALVFLGIQRTISGIKKILEGDTFKGVLRVIEGIAIAVAGIAILLGGWVVAIVAGVIAGVAFVIEYWEQIKTFFADLWENIKQGFSNLWESIVNIFEPVANWFDDKVIKPIMSFFSPIVKWFATLFGEIWKTISDVFNNIVGIFKGCWEIVKLVWGIASTWFNDTVVKPVAKVMTTMWDGLKNGAKIAWEGIKKVFSSVASFFKNTFQTAWEAVKKVFSIGGKIFDGIKDGIVSAFTTVVNAIIKGINKIVSIPFNGINKALLKIKNIEILGVEPFKDKINTIHVPQIPLLGFEQGGYPDKASLFFANENGIPELVGRIGNQTAVANNDQITTALTSALLTALSGADLGGQGTIVVNIGNKKVYEGMGEHIDSESERYGTSYVNI